MQSLIHRLFDCG